MARTSKRKRLLHKLRRVVSVRREAADHRFIFDETDTFEDDVDEQVEWQYDQVASSRYAFRKDRYRTRSEKWKTYLGEQSELNDEEFVGHFRVSREAFVGILKLIQGDPVFKPSGRRMLRGGPELHLLILLKYLGTFGNDNSSPKLALFFGVGKGSIKNYIRRAARALLQLEDSTVTWPDENERRLISTRIQHKFGFVNCVGMIDGTLLPLEFKPHKNGEDYFSRKGGIL